MTNYSSVFNYTSLSNKNQFFAPSLRFSPSFYSQFFTRDSVTFPSLSRNHFRPPWQRSFARIMQDSFLATRISAFLINHVISRVSTIVLHNSCNNFPITFPLRYAIIIYSKVYAWVQVLLLPCFLFTNNLWRAHLLGVPGQSQGIILQHLRQKYPLNISLMCL